MKISFSAQSIDHCHFSQDTFESITRREDDGLLSTRTPVIRASYLGFSVFDSLGNWSNPLKVQVSDPVISSLFSRSALRVDSNRARDNVFLTGGGKWGWDAAMRASVGYTCISCDAAFGRQNNQFVSNAILNDWRNPDFRYWMRCYADAGREYTRYITDNYWSTTSDDLIGYVLEDTNDNFNLARIVYQPVLSVPPETTYPFVVDVLLSTANQQGMNALNGPTPLVGARAGQRSPSPLTATWTTAIQPAVSFGPDVPMTDYTIHPVERWLD